MRPQVRRRMSERPEETHKACCGLRRQAMECWSGDQCPPNKVAKGHGSLAQSATDPARRALEALAKRLPPTCHKHPRRKHDWRPRFKVPTPDALSTYLQGDTQKVEPILHQTPKMWSQFCAKNTALTKLAQNWLQKWCADLCANFDAANDARTDRRMAPISPPIFCANLFWRMSRVKTPKNWLQKIGAKIGGNFWASPMRP